MEEKQKYVCPLCGTEHDTPEGMAHCVLACKEKQLAEEKRIQRERLEQERDKRWNEVIEAGDRYKKLYCQFVDDYRYVKREMPMSVWSLLWSL